ncbi:MAG: Gfo/Idh/MocA family oxidoreductase [Planctomycetota bacterium]
MTPLRFVVIGTGKIASKVTPRMQAAEGVEVVGVASRSIERARAFAAQHGLADAWTERDLLESPDAFDAAYVTAPNHLHPAWCARLTAIGKHTLCEKPIVWKKADAERIYDEARKTGVVVVEAFAYPHTEWMRALASNVESLIGPIVRIDGSFEIEIAAGPTDNVRYSRALAGGAMMDLGCYPMGVARILAGEPRHETIEASAEIVDLHTDGGGGVDGSSKASWTTASGVEVTVSCSMVRAGTHISTIIGKRGTIEIPKQSIPTGYAVTIDNTTETHGTPGDIDGGDGGAMYTKQAERFARAVAGTADSVPSPLWSISQADTMERVLAKMHLDLGDAPASPF